MDECPVCYEPYGEENPAKPLCSNLHSFCAACIERLDQCPLCREVVRPEAEDRLIQIYEDMFWQYIDTPLQRTIQQLSRAGEQCPAGVSCTNLACEGNHSNISVAKRALINSLRGGATWLDNMLDRPFCSTELNSLWPCIAPDCQLTHLRNMI
jgi:endogenous inhibitor of DNA gyrase (YacG/DUF329 family)